jgi:hypothetical protein
MIATLVCLLVMWAWHLLTPYWWGVMLVPFAYGAGLAKTGGKAIRTGLLSAGILWLGASLYFYFSGSGIIASRMAGMFGLGRPGLMIAATALVAAAAAGLSGYAGYAVGVLFRKPAKRTDTKERS